MIPAKYKNQVTVQHGLVGKNEADDPEAIDVFNGSLKTLNASVLTPSNYAGASVALTQAGDGYAIADGATLIEIGILTEPSTNAVILIAFGISELDAESKVSGTVGSELGKVVGHGLVGDTFLIGVPTDSTITHFALAENHATPSGVVMITQGA